MSTDGWPDRQVLLRLPSSEVQGGAHLAERYLAQRLAEARARLLRVAGAADGPVRHFRRPLERPFTAEERDRVTILFGGLTWKHERLIQAALQAAGYRAEPLPPPDLAACHLGRQYGNNGLCNPAYFTVGNLLKYLLHLEASGLSRQEILDRYVFFTAGACGPCRFGMYEAEYRLALRNAGFDGFRVLLFQQNQGVRADTGQPGFRFSLHLGLGALNAFLFADALHDLAYTIRPFEVEPGATDRAIADAVDSLARFLRSRRPVVLAECAPRLARSRLAARTGVARWAEILAALAEALYSRERREVLAACRARLDQVDVDYLRVKPVVKITGEFWAQTTEGDGNFNMFRFLEQEGAQVFVDPIGAWIAYLARQARAHARYRSGLDPLVGASVWRKGRARLAEEARLWRKWALVWLGEALYLREYARVARSFGGLVHPLPDQDVLAALARPVYHDLARGGEGHLEVAKNLYYTTRGGAHMVLSLKPFGCLPSSQSDGVQSAVTARVKDMIFLPVETAAEGELEAHSRVQMALVEARARARAEFEAALRSTGRRLEDIRAFVAAHPELRRPFAPIPRRPGVAGMAANFVLYVHDLMRGASPRTP
jgi:predicted nucleotide-binding protein (sugar kinase/HSP70/actin superfamily)